MAELQSNVATLRMKVASNHFKRLLLGGLHIPGKAQVTKTFEAINGKFDALNGVKELIHFTDKTWSSWFEEPNKIPRKGTIEMLDKIAESKIRIYSKNGIKEKLLPSDTFSHMIHGGLLKKMVGSKSRETLNALIARAREYQPVSALHLHLDAVEVSALTDAYSDISWEEVKKVGAERILQLLAEKWGPRQGAVYSEFSSSLRLEWNAATPDERLDIRKGYTRFKPDLFECSFDKVAYPSWSKTGIETDITSPHIYKALFALATDSDFLISDRLVAWSLDLATAALAMHALAWSDRYTTFTIPITDEQIYWIAFDEILFNSESIDTDNTEIVRAMMRHDADWSSEAFEKFSCAREIYRAELIELGVSTQEIFDVAMQSTQVHPLILKG